MVRLFICKGLVFKYVQKAKIHGHWGESSLTVPLPLSQVRSSGKNTRKFVVIVFEAFEVVKTGVKRGSEQYVGMIKGKKTVRLVEMTLGLMKGFGF